MYVRWITEGCDKAEGSTTEKMAGRTSVNSTERDIGLPTTRDLKYQKSALGR